MIKRFDNLILRIKFSYSLAIINKEMKRLSRLLVKDRLPIYCVDNVKVSISSARKYLRFTKMELPPIAHTRAYKHCKDSVFMLDLGMRVRGWLTVHTNDYMMPKEGK